MSLFKNATIQSFTYKFAPLFNQPVSFDFDALGDDRRFHRFVFRLVVSFLLTIIISIIPFIRQWGYFSSYYQTSIRFVPLLQMCLTVFSIIAGFPIFKNALKNTHSSFITRELSLSAGIVLLFFYSFYKTIMEFSPVYYGSVSLIITASLLYEFSECWLVRRHGIRNAYMEGEESPAERKLRLFSIMLNLSVVLIVPCFVIYSLWFKIAFDQIFLRITALLVAAGSGSLLFSVDLSKISVLIVLKKYGIFVKASTTFRKLVDAYVFMFMKTGVLTEGRFVVKDIEFSANLDSKPTEVLRLIGSLEQMSSHPIAKAFLDQLNPPQEGWLKVENFVIREGLGIEGSIGDRLVWAGRRELFQTVDYAFIRRSENEERNGNIVIFIGWGDKAYGIAVLAAALRSGIKSMALSLHDLRKLVCVLSGDSLHSVRGIAETCGIKNYVAEGSPGEKCIEIRNHQRRGREVVVIGDMRTDAEVMKQADVRVLLKKETEPQFGSADVIIHPENLTDLPVLVKYARNIFSVIHINTVWTLFYNAGVIILSFMGWIHPIAAAIFMTVSNLFMVISALKLKSFLKY